MKYTLALGLAGTVAARAITSRQDGSGSVQYLGRINPANNELTWPGTGVSFSFVGTTATIAVSSISGNNSADLIVDGGSPTVISDIEGSITVPSGLAEGTHTVVLRRRSETALGTLVLGEVTSDGGSVTATTPSARQIEVIGDSITVGYGLDGVGPCTNTAAVEDNPLTYAALAAASLGADYNVVAWSGKGIVRNYVTATPDTSPIMPELYTRYGANDADDSYSYPASWTPGAVVVNLGTNDFGYVLDNADGQPYDARAPLDPATYTNATVAFVQSIQAHYPAAHFFLMTSPMLSDDYPTTADQQKTTQTNALNAAVAQIGANAHLVDWPTQGSAVGCDYHPNAATHAAEAPVLASAIAQALGW